MRGGFAPSAEAAAFLNEPANRKTEPFDPADLPQQRAEGRAEAAANAPRIAAAYDVSLDWTEIGGVRCLQVTPPGWDGVSQLLYLFGGGFVAGGPLEDLMISAPLAAGTGLQVVAPAYPLAPEAPFPAGLNACLAVARSIGPSAVAGESAGGNLALGTVRALVAAGIAPRALALLSPAADLSPAFDPHTAPDDPMLGTDIIEKMPPLYAPGTDLQDEGVSPLYGSFGPGWPPCIITTGTRDRFLGQCAQLARAMRAAGGMADLRVWDGMWHVFEYYEDLPEARASLEEIADCLRERPGAS